MSGKESKKLWLVFLHNGRELLRVTVNGLSCGEVSETKKLLAYEKRIAESEITTDYEFC